MQAMTMVVVGLLIAHLPLEATETRLPLPGEPTSQETDRTVTKGLPRHGREHASTEQRIVTPTRPAPHPASGLVRQMLLPPLKHPGMAGTPVTLLELLSMKTDRRRQTELIDAYWDLSLAVAHYYLALDGAHRMDLLSHTLPASQDTAVAELKVAQASAQVEIQKTQLAAMEAQRKLAQLDRLTTDFPLPANRPHTGAYRTFYDEVFANLPSLSAKRLHETLPLRHRLVQDLATLVQARQALLRSVTVATGDDQLSLSEKILMYTQLSREQRDFLTAVRAYNQDITQYAQLSATNPTDVAGLVNMLIRTKPATPRPVPSSDGLQSVLKGHRSGTLLSPPGTASAVVQASAEEPLGEQPLQRPNRNVPSSDSLDGFVPRRSGLEP